MNQQLWAEINALPLEAQYELAEFVEMLKHRYAKLPPRITPGDKSVDPDSLFGIWQNQPRTLENIRIEAWRRL